MLDYCNSLPLIHSQYLYCYSSMTLGDISACDNQEGNRMETLSSALEEVLVAAKKNESLTIGVYESAMLMNVDPDRVVLCLLAADPEDEDNVALKIHFTLIKAFCCDNDINIVQVSGLQRLSEIIDGQTESSSEPRDLHCILVLDSLTDSWKCSNWDKISNYCAECRSRNQWVPFISLTER